MRYFGEKSMDGRFYVKVNVSEKNLFKGNDNLTILLSIENYVDILEPMNFLTIFLFALLFEPGPTASDSNTITARASS